MEHSSKQVAVSSHAGHASHALKALQEHPKSAAQMPTRYLQGLHARVEHREIKEESDPRRTK